MELSIFWQWGLSSFHIQERSYDKKYLKSMINICFVVCILLFAPYVYIKLPLGSSILGQWDIGSLYIEKQHKNMGRSMNT